MAQAPVQSRAQEETLDQDLVDEFTAPGEQRSLLERSRGLVQSFFPVQFTVLGTLESFRCEGNAEGKHPGRIWLKLRGRREAVTKAKEYVKSLCEPEIELKEFYPKEMHCIFAGAKSAFLNRLITDTSANIALLEMGVLSIKGGTEPVVLAQSHVQQFVSLFRNNQSLPQGREPEVKRRFKRFVEVHADKYTMDLLILPSALKEELLSLTSAAPDLAAPDDADLEISLVNASSPDTIPSDSDAEQSRPSRRTPVTELASQLDSVFSIVPGAAPNPACTPSSQADRSSSKRRSSENEERSTKRPFNVDCIQVDGPVPRSASPPHVPIIDLLSDSTATDDSLILLDDEDTVSPEREYKILVNFFKTMGYSQGVVEKVIAQLGQSEEPLKLLEAIEDESTKASPPARRKTAARELPVSRAESQPRQEVTIEPVPKVDLTRNELQWKTTPKASNHQVLGGPIPQYTEAKTMLCKNISFIPRGTTNPPQNVHILPDKPGPSNQPPDRPTKPVPLMRANVPHPAKCAARTEPPVTGVQIFRNSISTPYRLELMNQPGRPDLKHIIIDGSNVAMCHGLQKFFSCRGIAIAVEYFWKQGHRQITAFVPQWRTKRDPNITEQHLLQQLEELGILSFTPSRTVMGSRIASHDDRFLLHLAERTGGIIVTNDNLREFVLESPVWMQIIKERLLQFTFAGDNFMIPDDPLGRNGPRLEDFLCKNPHKRNYPPTPQPADSGVFFPSHDTSFPRPVATNIGHVFPRSNPPLSLTMHNMPRPQAYVPPKRSYHETLSLKDSLLKIFPESEQREKINQILSAHPYMRDLNALSAMVLD